MTTRISYNAGTVEGKQVAEFVDAVQTVLAKGRRLNAQLNSMTYGTPADYAHLEAEIGGMTAGQGQPLWYIISTSMSAIDCPQVAALAQLDQGG